MRVPLAWLRDYVDLTADADQIAAKFAELGFPVEHIERRPHIDGVVVGRIDAIEKHPNADRLHVCTVDVGEERKLTIATAATNVARGQTVPVAKLGAHLPHLTIAPRKMRGVDSEGMLVSAEELALPGEWFEDGILQLDMGTPVGKDVVQMFRLDDPVFEVEVTANRPDALSILGLARELAAGFGTSVKEPENTVTYGGVLAESGEVGAMSYDSHDARITLESLDCRRFVMQRISRVRVRPAKTWLRFRLALAGQRPINNLVDISNFVMLEVGQPTAFYDFDRVKGKHIVVRDARDGETITTLDDEPRTLTPVALIIADDAGPVGLAGLKGGAESGVHDDTTELIIESATFVGPRIRRMSVALGLRTEASTRNEKGLPIALSDLGAARCARLLEQEGALIHMPRGFGRTAGLPVTIHVPHDEIARLLGFTISPEAARHALHALGFEVKDVHGGYDVIAPQWRADVTIAPDLVEEIARVVGYDHVRAELPVVEPQDLSSNEYDREMGLARALASQTYREVLTLSLQPASVAERWRTLGQSVPPPVEIVNPLSEDQRWLRFAQLPAMLDLAARDRERPYRRFEIGRVFHADGETIVERDLVTVLLAQAQADEPEWRDATFGTLIEELRAVLRALTGNDLTVHRSRAFGMHPGITAELRAGEDVVAHVGALDPRVARSYEIDGAVAVAYIDPAALPAHAIPPWHAPSRFPAVERDLALVVDTPVAAGDLVAAVRELPRVRSAEVFDEYRGPQIGGGKKSLALRVRIGRDDGTPTDADADAAVAAIVTQLHERFGATQRT